MGLEEWYPLVKEVAQLSPICELQCGDQVDLALKTRARKDRF